MRGRALDLRGSADPETDGRDLEQASRKLADAMIDEAAGDPEVSEIEVRDLREGLAARAGRLGGPKPVAFRGSSVAATLEFKDATKRYPGADEAAVDSLSLEVPAGEICVLVGPSGCGKTTAMRMVNRMIEITERRHPAGRRERHGRARPPSCGARSATRSSRSASSPT